LQDESLENFLRFARPAGSLRLETIDLNTIVEETFATSSSPTRMAQGIVVRKRIRSRFAEDEADVDALFRRRS